MLSVAESLRAKILEPDCLDLNPSSTVGRLCDLQHISKMRMMSQPSDLTTGREPDLLVVPPTSFPERMCTLQWETSYLSCPIYFCNMSASVPTITPVVLTAALYFSVQMNHTWFTQLPFERPHKVLICGHCSLSSSCLTWEHIKPASLPFPLPWEETTNKQLNFIP